ncbi:nucleoside 2-deoxyribosyltransferase [Aquincola tertiaricarbonis]|uniref:Nucleoside 2-deoxyribosyltransferase n=1 Tax=Aquincola tertiaricarbonis TaxID=391953 RepID=A0ABY4RZK0_AQUTE|nr:nucleoside 2-deoxyribosyltransferase [Aquincola tertiaricarbonis]URI05824.1 nucleoside 2-deoxyribosyltransferase [Aquincola tertiaricarbonis]
MERFDHNRPLVYLAAPLFSEAELNFNLALTTRIEASLDVYLPQRDGGKLVDLLACGVEENAAYKSIFDRDLRALDAACALIIVLDGRAIDEGAAFELGYAYAHRKLCFGLQTDPRRLLPAGNNPMIEMPLQKIFRSIESAGEWADSFARSQITL